jgi:hypothetical protein
MLALTLPMAWYVHNCSCFYLFCSTSMFALEGIYSILIQNGAHSNCRMGTIVRCVGLDRINGDVVP